MGRLAGPIMTAATSGGASLHDLSAASGGLYLGDFRQVLIGLRSDARVEVSASGDDTFTRHQIGIKIVLRADINFAHADMFCYLSGIS